MSHRRVQRRHFLTPELVASGLLILLGLLVVFLVGGVIFCLATGSGALWTFLAGLAVYLWVLWVLAR